MSHISVQRSAVRSWMIHTATPRPSAIVCTPSATPHVDTHWRPQRVQRHHPIATVTRTQQHIVDQLTTIDRRALFASTLAALLAATTPLGAVAAALPPAAINPALAPDQRLYDAADPALRDAAALLQRALNANTVQVGVSTIIMNVAEWRCMYFRTGGGGPLHTAG